MKALKRRLLSGISYEAVDVACSKEHLALFHRALVEFVRDDPAGANAWLIDMGVIGKHDVIRLAAAK